MNMKNYYLYRFTHNKVDPADRYAPADFIIVGRDKYSNS